MSRNSVRLEIEGTPMKHMRAFALSGLALMAAMAATGTQSGK
ncbi:MAG: hypothetical protein WAL73_21385 [Terracidiphilus sp.]